MESCLFERSGEWWVRNGDGSNHRLLDIAPTLERDALKDEYHMRQRRELQMTEWIKDGPYPYRWSTVDREGAKKAAAFAADHILNGPASGDLRKASLGVNEDLLFAVHLIMMHTQRLERNLE